MLMRLDGILDGQIMQAELAWTRFRSAGLGSNKPIQTTWPGRWDHSPAPSIAISLIRRPPL